MIKLAQLSPSCVEKFMIKLIGRTGFKRVNRTSQILLKLDRFQWGLIGSIGSNYVKLGQVNLIGSKRVELDSSGLIGPNWACWAELGSSGQIGPIGCD